MNARFPSGVRWFSLLAVFATSHFATAQAFSIAAANVVMPSSGSATSQYTIKNIPITGTIIISCANDFANDPSTRAPVCYTGLPHATQVAAGQTLSGTIQFMPFAVPLPGIIVVPIALLFGLMLHRRRNWMLMALAIGALTTSAVSACGGGSSGLTPGNYQFTVSASNNPAAGEGPSYVTQTTVTVKVP